MSVLVCSSHQIAMAAGPVDVKAEKVLSWAGMELNLDPKEGGQASNRGYTDRQVHERVADTQFTLVVRFRDGHKEAFNIPGPAAPE